MSDFQFVSPGFKSREIDLTEAIESFGLTSLGLVGETQKGPAFQLMSIRNGNEFGQYFGSKSNEKLGGQIRYQLPYVAMNYLSEGNQLHVVRVLGLSGYNAGAAWVIGDTNRNQLCVLRSRATYVGLDTTPTFKTVSIAVSGVLTGKLVTDSFILSVQDSGGATVTYSVSLDPSKADYIGKVFGTSPKDKNTPCYVEQIFPAQIKKLAAVSAQLGYLYKFSEPVVSNYKTRFTSPETPWVVSELRGSSIERLFKFISISDGESANFEIKPSISNINPETREFDISLRAFDDQDSDVVILERFERCSMNPDLPNYVAKRIGTIDGAYDQRSRYVSLELSETAPIDSFPAGFEGFSVRNYNHASFVNKMLPAAPVYKKTYISTERVSRAFLGLSDMFGNKDILRYYGVNIDGGVDYSIKTKGFHMDSGATGTYGINGVVGQFEVGAAPLRSANDVLTGAYMERVSRKFTLAFAGGFDGWDIHRSERTNKGVYKKGLTLNADLANPIETDYYSFLQGIRTFANPEDVYINIFATPGLNLEDHEDLVREGIDMIERERADAVYLIDSPDYSTYDQLVDVVDAAGLDTSYGATFGPWIQGKDAGSSSNVFMPPTFEVVRNIAYTDNKKFPWFATAGVNRGVTRSKKARFKPNETHRGEMLKVGINPLATFNQIGVVIWGNRTLQRKESALQDLNIRRLLLEIRKKISVVSITLLFEQNDDKVRDEFLQKINPIMDNIKRERGLFKYQIKLDTDTNPEITDRKTMTGSITLWPIGALENIGMSFVLTDSGAAFA